MRFLRLILLLLCIDASAQQFLPIKERNGQIVVLVTDKQYKPHKLTLDTGASISVVYDMRLLDDMVRADGVLYGVGNNEVIVEYGGKLALNFIEAYAYYIEMDGEGIDGILGLDWMLEHKARIDLGRMVVEYW